jgi:hypothetical protein
MINNRDLQDWINTADDAACIQQTDISAMSTETIRLDMIGLAEIVHTAVDVIREQEAEIGALVLERDEAVRIFNQLATDVNAAIGDIETALNTHQEEQNS